MSNIEDVPKGAEDSVYTSNFGYLVPPDHGSSPSTPRHQNPHQFLQDLKALLVHLAKWAKIHQDLRCRMMLDGYGFYNR
jgi:hypothetical protein